MQNKSRQLHHADKGNLIDFLQLQNKIAGIIYNTHHVNVSLEAP